MSVAGSKPLPTFSLAMRVRSFWVSFSLTPSCTIRRLQAVQRCPVVPNALQRIPSTARSRSASSITRMAFFPPISSATRLYRRAVSSATFPPVWVEPVNEMTATSSWLTNHSPSFGLCPRTRFTTPGGMPDSPRTLTNRAAATGVSGEGLSTTVLPRISAGNIVAAGVRASSDQLARGRIETVKGFSTAGGYPLAANEVVEDHLTISPARPAGAKTPAFPDVSCQDFFQDLQTLIDLFTRNVQRR